MAAILRAAADPHISLNRLARVVSVDPAFTVELLRLVNSPLIGLGREVRSAQEAVPLLGVRTLRNLALCTATRSCFQRSDLGDFPLDRFWEESLRRAVAAQLLASKTRKIEPTEAFTLGLIQDLGLLLLVLDAGGADGWDPSLDHDEQRRWEAEALGGHHEAASLRLARSWGMPEDVAIPLRWHHDTAPCPPRHRDRAELMRLADSTARVLSDPDPARGLTSVQEQLQAAYQMSARDVDVLFNTLAKEVARTAEALGLSVGEQPSLDELLRTANEGLAAMNVSYEALVRQLEEALAKNQALQAQLEERNRDLERLMLTDPLTLLPNRRAFDQRLETEIRRVARLGGDLHLLIGDIDHFKSVNDTWGHDFGDVALKWVSHGLQDVIRTSDFIARIGGEEFALILPATDQAGALVAAQKVLKSLRSRPLIAPDGRRRKITLSLGAAFLSGPWEHTVSPNVRARLYRSADLALYEAKNGGRDRYAEANCETPWGDSRARTLRALGGTSPHA